jgi:ATP-dependent DNA helicase RecG
MKTTVEELERLMTSPSEDEHLEFKEAKNQYDTTKLFRYCVALANERGGKLILGVTDKRPRQVVGTQAFLNTEEIKARLVELFNLRIELETIRHPDGRVLIFHVPSRPVGFALNYEGAYWMRAGESLVPMTYDQLKRITEEGSPDLVDRVALGGLSGDAVVSLLDTQSYFDLIRQPYPTRRESVLERFADEKLIHERGGQYEVTNLGALLFAKNLRDFDLLARKAPRVIVFEGKGKFVIRSDHTPVKGYATGFESLIDYVNGHLPSNEVIGTALRQTTRMFPEIAVRELVANALIHQDFNQTGISVTIEIYSDRMEVTSPGQPHLSTERFIDGYQSRNEKLAGLMRRLRICEEQGSGVDKVIDSVERFQLPAPDFRVTETHTVAVLFGHQNFEAMGKDDRVRACYQHCCLKWVMNERMTNQSLRERFKLGEEKVEQVSRIIRDTVDAGKIKTEDANPSKRYAKYVPFWV